MQHLVNMYRVRGHLIANLDPLGLKKPHTHPELDPIHWGLTIWDLDREFPTGWSRGPATMKLRDILGVLRDAYAARSASSTCTSRSPTRRTGSRSTWRVCTSRSRSTTSAPILGWLNAAEAFERFLHTKFLGQKRFSLEGAETLIPLLAFLLDAAADAGMTEVVMGMSHRGRLDVLANIVGKSYAQIFREFEGELDPNVPQGSGDVKYHVGATGKFASRSGRRSASRSRPTPATSRRSTRWWRAWRAPSRAAATTTSTSWCCRCCSTAMPRSRARAWSRRRSTCRSCPATRWAAPCTSS